MEAEPSIGGGGCDRRGEGVARVSRMRLAGVGVLIAVAAVGCKKSESARRVAEGKAASPSTAPTTATPSTATSTSTGATTSTLPDASRPLDPAAAAALLGDGGAQACRVVFGPKELPVLSPPFVSVRGDVVEAILDEDG